MDVFLWFDANLLMALAAFVILIVMIEIIGRKIDYPQNEVLNTPEFIQKQEKIEAGYGSTLSMQSVKEEPEKEKEKEKENGQAG